MGPVAWPQCLSLGGELILVDVVLGAAKCAFAVGKECRHHVIADCPTPEAFSVPIQSNFGAAVCCGFGVCHCAFLFGVPPMRAARLVTVITVYTTLCTKSILLVFRFTMFPHKIKQPTEKKGPLAHANGPGCLFIL